MEGVQGGVRHRIHGMPCSHVLAHLEGHMDILDYNAKVFENELKDIDRELSEYRKKHPPRWWVDIIRRRRWKRRK